jgi:hypothetical protein
MAVGLPNSGTGLAWFGCSLGLRDANGPFGGLTSFTISAVCLIQTMVRWWWEGSKWHVFVIDSERFVSVWAPLRGAPATRPALKPAK